MERVVPGENRCAGGQVMQNFVFENPTKIIFGRGQIRKVGPETARYGKKVLLVYGGGSIKTNGIYDQVLDSLNGAGISVVEFSGVRSNPVVSHTREGIALARKENVDAVVAVGGGSVIDEAKTIAAGTKADHDVWDFFIGARVIKAALPVLTVLTLSASASEMNPAAVITNEEGAYKFSINSPFIRPKASILDPSALFTVSPAYTAYSAVDIITHMLEGYFNNEEPDSILQDRLVEGIMKTLMESTEAVLRDPEDYNGRAKMMWSATIGFNGLTVAGMGRVMLPAHMIEHSLSALYDIAHGAGLSIVLPAWMSHAVQAGPAKFARLAREVFGVTEPDDAAAGRAGIDHLKNWFASIGSPVSLAEANIPATDIGNIAANAEELARVWRLNDYTREVIADILDICK